MIYIYIYAFKTLLRCTYHTFAFMGYLFCVSISFVCVTPYSGHGHASGSSGRYIHVCKIVELLF